MASVEIKTCDIFKEPTRPAKRYRICIQEQTRDGWADAVEPKVVDLSNKALDRARRYVARATLPPKATDAEVIAASGVQRKKRKPKSDDVKGQQVIPGCEDAKPAIQ